MTPERFHEICVEASKKAVREHGQIGFLKLSTNDDGESLIREPEMIYAFAATLSESRLYHGIEVPTDGQYRFVDQDEGKKMRARHDLVIFGKEGPDVLVELKRGQPAKKGDDHPAISKDLRKLLLEKAAGKSMFHICHASFSDTLPAVVSKYVVAFRKAWASVDVAEAERASAGSWFAFYLLVLYERTKEKQAVLRRFLAPTLAELRGKMLGLTVDDFNLVDTLRAE